MISNSSFVCPLCENPSDLFFENTYDCPKCRLIFKSKNIFLTKTEEDKRYRTHQNTSGDQGYIDFLNKLAIPLKEFVNNTDEYLDFGCGPYSQLTHLVEPNVSKINFYDPLFFPEEKLLSQKYDVVTCTEVVEHFQKANEDWEKLVSVVKSGGVLGIMTQYYHDEINYKDWWYKNDPTHVVFYREETLSFLAKKYQMKILYNDHRSVMILQNG